MPEQAGFCGQCGTVIAKAARARTAIGHASPSDAPPPLPPPAAPPPADVAVAADQPLHQAKLKTMLGGVGFELPPTPAPAAAAASGAAPGVPTTAPMDAVPPQGALAAAAEPVAARPLGTMLGISAAEMLPPQSRAGGVPPVDAAAAAAAGAPEHRTMLGVAMPGIAPLHEAPPPPAQGDHRTMLGVAVPGVAPLHAGASTQLPPTQPSGPTGTSPLAQQPMRYPPGAGPVGDARPSRPRQPAALPPIVPAPPPLTDDEPVPLPPARPERRGFPIALVAGGVALLVVLVGAIALFVMRSGPPLIVQPRLGAQGNELLHLVCESCPDGTVADHDGTKATFKDKQADLDLAKPLVVGDNPVTITLDRPGAVARDETVKAVVPIAYRVRADLADLTAAVPAIGVRVEALPGSKITVDGKPVDLDAQGKGSHEIELHAETEGASDEGKVVEKTIPYEVTAPKATAPERGTVIVRFGVIPLHVDAPGATLVTDKDKIWVAGRTAKGATVAVNGKPVDAASGVFAVQIDAAPDAETAIEVRSSAPQVAPRIARAKVKRVKSVDADAKAFEASSHLGYDAVNADVAANTGQPLVVEGKVLEARVLNHETVSVVDDKRGCAKGPCIVRVTYGAESDVRGGDVVHAYGTVIRPFKTPDGKTVPEVDAQILVKARR